MVVVGARRNTKFIFVLTLAIASANAQTPPAAQARGKFVNQYCIGCHSEHLKTGGVVLENIDAARVRDNAAVWERVLRQAARRQMPPVAVGSGSESAADFYEFLHAEAGERQTVPVLGSDLQPGFRCEFDLSSWAGGTDAALLEGLVLHDRLHAGEASGG